MDITSEFKKTIDKGYTFNGESITLGGAMIGGQCLQNTLVKIPLKTLNRHGLIAGATGTGKTKTLQVLAEGLSEKSIPVLLMDLKGDLSGLAKPSGGHPKIDERHNQIGISWKASGFPVELLTISKQNGVRLRSTVSEFGPVLFSKILDLNDTQTGVVSLIFKYCDDKSLPLLDLKDFKKAVQFITNEGKEEIEKDYGRISTASTGAIIRKIIEIEQQGAGLFFGEKSFEVEDLLKIDQRGRGKISIIRLTDIQDKPKMFSTFMLSLLAEIYSSFPEEGDLDYPKLVIFIDEAHLMFDQASKALLEQIEMIIKLIRSKAVGIYFCTQTPRDIPDSVLSQLGMKVQHALRAFTAKDRKTIKMIAENYPISKFYKTNEVLTSMGIGEALITVLNEKGIPTPLVATLLRAPRSRMDILTKSEITEDIDSSRLVKKYNETLDRDSAYEILERKINEFKDKEKQEELKKEREKIIKQAKRERKKTSLLNSSVGRQIGRTVARELTRGILGVLGLGGKTRRRRRRKPSFSWF
jgi:DNA helicase HerA-like ATPase